MKYAFLSFANVARDDNFVKVLTVSLLLGIWGLQLIELDTLLFSRYLQGKMLKVFDLYVKPKYVFYLDSSTLIKPKNSSPNRVVQPGVTDPTLLQRGILFALIKSSCAIKKHKPRKALHFHSSPPKDLTVSSSNNIQ